MSLFSLGLLFGGFELYYDGLFIYLFPYNILEQ